MDGFLLVDKPAGWTSHDVVAKVRGIIKYDIGQKIRVGHTGTLDPFATGLLVLVLGSYTKQAGEFSKLDKVYEAELTLGSVSSTGDPEGKITPKSTQKPPKYSAVKIGGRRAYKLARQGAEVKTEPRRVKIHEITDVEYNYPKLKFTCKVS